VRGALLSLVASSACSLDHGRLTLDARVDDAIDGMGSGSDAPTCKATAIAASSAHTCAAMADGSVRCWGINRQGELGRSPTSMDTEQCNVGGTDYPCITKPIDAKVPVVVTALGMADQHSCAIGGGKVYCWGANDSGQFGSGNNGDQYAPFEVIARAGAMAITGGEAHTCSLAAGVLSCSGQNANGEVGNGNANTTVMPYVAANGVTAFGVGFQNVYAIVGSTIRGWGNNDTRQLDNSGMSPRTTPITISGVTGAVAVAGGTNHVCAVLANQTAACWGANTMGQLGRKTATAEEAPSAVTITDKISTLTAGTNHTCVKLADKTVLCFGEQYPLDGLVIQLPAPAAQITSGSYHDCALLEDGTVWCWGWNAYGQYGNGTTSGIDNVPRQAQVCP
jgi:alpha-tubulin suppressor-like RCC1 family protein